MNTIDSIENSNIYPQKSTSNLKKTDSSEFTEIMKEKSILDELSEKYNLNVAGSSKFNLGSMTTLTIAPNILKEMANNPQRKAYYEGVIKDYFDQEPSMQAFDAAMGNVELPATITFNSDGSWVESVGSEPSPAKLAKIRKEQEEKKKKKQEEEKMFNDISNPMNALVMSSELKGNKLRINKI